MHCCYRQRLYFSRAVCPFWAIFMGLHTNENILMNIIFNFCQVCSTSCHEIVHSVPLNNALIRSNYGNESAIDAATRFKKGEITMHYFLSVDNHLNVVQEVH